MKMTLISSLILMASMAVVNADFDAKAFRYYLLADAIYNTGQSCALYGQSCNNNAPCCQYYGRDQLDCFSGVCKQAVCGYPGQQCGYFIGECCYHQGLYCNYQYGFEGICVSSTVAI